MTARSNLSAARRRLARLVAEAAPGRRGSTGPRPGPAADRLVPAPVFLLTSVRSGSTLLRVILDSHSQICAPHEMHLAALRVETSGFFGELAMQHADMSRRDLENLLWDRILHLRLTQAGKRIIVDKTPYNTIDWRRIAAAWPSARYVFLTRHPLRIYESLLASRPDLDASEHYVNVNRYTTALAEAMAVLPGAVVRYEDLTTDPQRVVRRLCGYLGVRWEPDMLRYGDHDHGGYQRGLGDWGPKIRSGRIDPARPAPAPAEIPPELTRSCRALGYL